MRRVWPWLVVVLATFALGAWIGTMGADERPPRNAAEAAQREREIIAGTRVVRSSPGQRAEQAELALQRRQRDEADQPVELYRQCQDAVRRHLLLASDVVVDDGQTPPRGTLVQLSYRGARQVSATELQPDPIIGSPLETPLSGAYQVHGTVRIGRGAGADFKVYDCAVDASPPRYRVSSVTVRSPR